VHGEPNSLVLCASVNISVANAIKFCAVLNTCVDLLGLNHGRQLHSFIIHCGYKEDVSVANGLINIRGKCGDIVSAEMVFSRIGCKRNVILWCFLLAALVQNHDIDRAQCFC